MIQKDEELRRAYDCEMELRAHPQTTEPAVAGNPGRVASTYHTPDQAYADGSIRQYVQTSMNQEVPQVQQVPQNGNKTRVLPLCVLMCLLHSRCG